MKFVKDWGRLDLTSKDREATIHHTATELIIERADTEKKNMGFKI